GTVTHLQSERPAAFGAGDPEPAGLGVLDRDRPTARRAGHGHGATPGVGEIRPGPSGASGPSSIHFRRSAVLAEDRGGRHPAVVVASARRMAATSPSQVYSSASAATSQPSRRAASDVTGLMLASRIVWPTWARAGPGSVACSRAVMAEL